jgi:hypothetical protein
MSAILMLRQRLLKRMPSKSFGSTHIGRIGRLSTDTEQLVAHADRPLARVMDG